MFLHFLTTRFLLLHTPCFANILILIEFVFWALVIISALYTSVSIAIIVLSWLGFAEVQLSFYSTFYSSVKHHLVTASNNKSKEIYTKMSTALHLFLKDSIFIGTKPESPKISKKPIKRFVLDNRH